MGINITNTRRPIDRDELIAALAHVDAAIKALRLDLASQFIEHGSADPLEPAFTALAAANMELTDLIDSIDDPPTDAV